MAKLHTLDIAAFTGQTWLIDPDIKDALLAQLVTNGQVVFSLDETPVHYTDYNWVYYPEAAQPNSIAVLSIKGVIYDYYAEYLTMKLSALYADKNVVGLIVKMNSPGGAADAGYRIADSLLNAPIPTWCHIEYGQAGSAGYMIGCSCDGLSASRANDRVGSIGTYISYQDWSKYYEKMGVVSRDIYAEQSSEKNLEGREAAKGNFKPLQTYVSQEAQAFIDYVKARRPGIKTDVMDPFKGKVFSATDALSIGLIDSIGTLKEAITSVTSKNLVSNATPRTTMFGFIKLAALVAIQNTPAADITEAQIEAANADLVAAGFKGLALVSQSQYETAVAALNSGSADPAALTTAQAEVTRLTTKLGTVNTKIKTLEEEKTTLQAEVARLGALNGAEKTTPAKGAETQADAGNDDTATVLASLPHNKALEGNPLFN